MACMIQFLQMSPFESLGMTWKRTETTLLSFLHAHEVKM